MTRAVVDEAQRQVSQNECQPLVQHGLTNERIL